MSAQLSKLHVRFIQSQKNFTLLQGDSKQKLPLSQLYVKDNNFFYFINTGKAIQENQNISILFKEKTHALQTLECGVNKQEISAGSEEFEDALLFFNEEESKVTQLFLLEISSLEQK